MDTTTVNTETGGMQTQFYIVTIQLQRKGKGPKKQACVSQQQQTVLTSTTLDLPTRMFW